MDWLRLCLIGQNEDQEFMQLAFTLCRAYVTSCYMYCVLRVPADDILSTPRGYLASTFSFHALTPSTRIQLMRWDQNGPRHLITICKLKDGFSSQPYLVYSPFRHKSLYLSLSQVHAPKLFVFTEHKYEAHAFQSKITRINSLELWKRILISSKSPALHFPPTPPKIR